MIHKTILLLAGIAAAPYAAHVVGAKTALAAFSTGILVGIVDYTLREWRANR